MSRSGKATTAASALEHALIARFGTLGHVETPFLLRSDNALVFTSRLYTALVKSYGLKQEFFTPFGERIFVNGSLPQTLRFPGQRDDSETSLFENWHRDYDVTD